jgi:hypothetical protein
MKKIILSITILFSCINIINAQTLVQASVGAGSTSDAVKVYIKTNAPGAISFSTLQFNIAVPTGTPVASLVQNPAFSSTSFTWTIDPPTVEAGYTHYAIYTPTAPIVYSKTDGTETEVFEIRLAGVAANTIHLLTLIEGGNNNNGLNLFYATGTNGVTNSNGNLQLYYVRPGTSVVNGFSYRPTGGLSDAISYAKLSSVVNVNFTSFTATKKENDAVLTWAVENESATTDMYEVERSIDGITFDKVTEVKPRLNGFTSNAYNITDANIANLRNNGIIYYRIKQIDVNGRAVYTDIKNVRLVEKAGLISAYPNPTKDYTTVRIDATEVNDVLLSVISAEGKQVMVSTLKVQKGVNLKKLDLSTLAAGNYIIKATIAGEVKTLNVIKI